MAARGVHPLLPQDPGPPMLEAIREHAVPRRFVALSHQRMYGFLSRPFGGLDLAQAGVRLPPCRRGPCARSLPSAQLPGGRARCLGRLTGCRLRRRGPPGSVVVWAVVNEHLGDLKGNSDWRAFETLRFVLSLGRGRERAVAAPGSGGSGGGGTPGRTVGPGGGCLRGAAGDGRGRRTRRALPRLDPPRVQASPAYAFVREIPQSPVGKVLRRRLIASDYDP